MHVTRQISRRTVLKATGAAAAAASIATAATPSVAAGGAFAHPGLLHTGADLARMAARVRAGASPYTAGYAKLTANPHSRSGWTARPRSIVYRGTELRPRSTWPQNYGILYNDIHAAYQNALRYHVSGDGAHADTAVAILNAWSAKLTKVDGSADRFLAAGIYGYQAANAAELVRDHSDFQLERFQKMLLDVFYSVSEDFLVNHNNGTAAPHYWPNWDLCNMACALATGIFCDDRAKVERAAEYFKHGAGMGSIKHAIPVVHDDGLGEWMEAGRDQGHSLMGVGLMGTFCEMAWNQGIDLYGYDDNRFLKALSTWPSGAWAETCRTRPTPAWTIGRGSSTPPTSPPPTRRRCGRSGPWSPTTTPSDAGCPPRTSRRSLPRPRPRVAAGTTGPTAAGSTNSASGRWRSRGTRRRSPPRSPPIPPRAPSPARGPGRRPPHPHPHPPPPGATSPRPARGRPSGGRPPRASPPSPAACSSCAAAARGAAGRRRKSRRVGDLRFVGCRRGQLRVISPMPMAKRAGH